MKHLLIYIFIFIYCTHTSVAQDKIVSPNFIEDSTQVNSGKKKKKQKEQEREVEDDYVKTNVFKYDNAVYVDFLKSIMLYRNGFELTDPIISLHSEEQLKISFDDISNELKTFNFTLLHCDANWEPSGIFQQDYLGGFTDDYFRTYRYSFNTTQKFIHHEALFPNENIKITKSGNYILKVYQDYDPEKIILSRRFMVVDNKVMIQPWIKRPTQVEFRNSKQEVDFTIDHTGVNIPNPFGDVKVVVMQNGRWDNAIYGLQPTFIQDQQLVYDFDDKNLFDGGNEFRDFDIRSLRFLTQNINRIEYDSSKHYNVHLLNAEQKAFKRYSYKGDINGKFFISVKEGQNPDTDADYAYVHFYYPAEKPFTEGDLYIYGQLSDWTFSREFKMKYDEKHQCYVASPFLKQGFYNYKYVLLNDKEKKPDDTYTEGNFFDTENDYTFLMYYRQLGTNYEQLIGYLKYNTIKN